MSFAYAWFRFERLMVAARCLGAAERLVAEMTAFAQQRRAGGRPISGYGLVAGMLADSMTELFAARSLGYETARGIDRGIGAKVAHAQCSMAKLYCSEMAGRIADRAVQVFGGRGYMRENVAERFYRELRVERIWEGTSEVQRAIIAGQMAKRGPSASISAGSSGSVIGRNRASTVPSGPSRNFSKFHWMSPVSPAPSGCWVSSV
jgi:alkylation response protein AidB-like acyl-CoA dehydrogenase